jgi:hypothetical protein
VDVFGANGPFDIFQSQGAVGLIGNRPGHDPAQCGHSPLFEEEGVALVAQDDFFSSPAMGQKRHEIPHGSAGNEQGRFHSEPLRRNPFEPIDGGVFPEDIVSHFGPGHGPPHGRCGPSHRVASKINPLLHISLPWKALRIKNDSPTEGAS